MVRKTIQQAKANLEQSLSIIQSRYESGIQGADWKTAAGSENAEKNFAAAMQKVISEKTRQKGIAAVSNEEWLRKAAAAASRLPEGLRNALDDYERGFAPILDAMNSAAARAPARSTDFIANIDNRLKPVVRAAKQAAGKL